jgi:hypothetical protein
MAHALGFMSVSLLVGQRISLLASCTGLFLIGPKMPLGSFCVADHDLPPSVLVLISPHQVLGDGPSL